MNANKIFSFILIFGGLLSCKNNKFASDSSDPSLGPDPLFKYAWHLSNTGQSVFATASAKSGIDLNILNVWSQGYEGSGVLIQVSDDGVEDTHEDLTSNFAYTNQSKNYILSSPFTSTTARPSVAADNHGTSVSGLIAAAASNGKGSRGVAAKAKLLSANFLSNSVSQTQSKYLDQASGDFDISNMSWGIRQNTILPVDTSYSAQLKTMVTTKRGGKGTIFVKSSGNDFAVDCNGSSTTCIGNANFDPDNVIPYLVVVAAINASGDISSYSSPGSSVWVSSFGGEFGSDSPAMLTTDRTGCNEGYAKSSNSTAFEKGSSSENSNCNYTSTFNGTSAAAPVLTGVIALLLEANPNLTWRDVKYILAKTATVDNPATGSINHPISTVPVGYVWEQKWVTNAANFKYQNWFGFGRVNTNEAVALAKSFISSPVNLGTYTETNWAHANTGLSLGIPDNDANGVTNVINVAQNLTVEAVQIQVAITHADISELAIELTSPSGTKSILVNARNSLTGIANLTTETFLTNAFYQENSAGNWTLRVVDAKAATTGTVTSFKLNIVGGSH